MSDYFDALIRSSGMTIGSARPASTPVHPAALDVDIERATTGTDPGAMRPALTPNQPLVPPHTPDAMEMTEPPRVFGRAERHTHEEPETPPAPVRGAKEGAVHAPQQPSVAPLESPMPDLGHPLVRAAMRWIAAGSPQAGPDREVGPISDSAPGVPGRRHATSTVHEDIATIPTKRLHRDDDDGKLTSLNGTPATPAPLNVPAEQSAEKPPAVRASLVPQAPPALVAPPVRDEVVEVSIGAIHVCVDAPPAQTVARPALTPAGRAAGAATSRPARSALSRRALRRI